MYTLQYEKFKCWLKLKEVIKQDCEKMLLVYDNCKNYNFEAFVSVWKSMSSELVFTNKVFLSDMHLYASNCFFLITKYFMFSKSLYIKTGAFYLLYSLYSMQNSKEPTKIRLVPAAVKMLSEMEEQLKLAECDDFVYILYRLQEQGAFIYTITWLPLGYEHKFSLEVMMKNDIFKENKDMLVKSKESAILLHKDKSVEELETGMQEYQEALKKYEEKIGKTVGLQDATNIIDRVNEIYNAAPVERESCADESEIYLRRRDIRTKAFSGDGLQSD